MRPVRRPQEASPRCPPRRPGCRARACGARPPERGHGPRRRRPALRRSRVTVTPLLRRQIPVRGRSDAQRRRSRGRPRGRGRCRRRNRRAPRPACSARAPMPPMPRPIPAPPAVSSAWTALATVSSRVSPIGIDVVEGIPLLRDAPGSPAPRTQRCARSPQPRRRTRRRADGSRAPSRGLRAGR